MNIEESFQHAMQQHLAGNRNAAENVYREILRIKPDHADSLHMLGVLAYQAKRYDWATDFIGRAVGINPSSAEYQFNLGMAQFNLGHVERAATTLEKAVALRPNFPEANFQLGNALMTLKKFDRAVEAYRRAVAQKPDYADAQDNLGVALAELGNLSEALHHLKIAISLKPNLMMLNNLGTLLREMGDLRGSIDAYNKALEVDPKSPHAHWNRGMSKLLLGQMKDGWEDFEWRENVPEYPSPGKTLKQPKWNGQPLEGKKIFIYSEQGFGDAIQFVRYAKLVIERGGTPIVASFPDLARLFSRIAGAIVVTNKDTMPMFDYHCAMLSLPGKFGTDLENMPKFEPYLTADPADIEKWKSRTEGGGARKIGLAWAGHAAHRRDRARSVKLADLAPLASTGNAKFFSLQKGDAASEAKSPLSGIEVADFSSELNDFADTAGLIANLDLVISVDTAVAHLAGAMGKPTWLLLAQVPDWRWMLHRNDSPWYPGMRLFRQEKPGDWNGPIQEMVAAIHS